MSSSTSTKTARVDRATSTSRKDGTTVKTSRASQTRSETLRLDNGVGATSSVVATRIGFLVVVACLLVFGLVMLYSASSIYSYNLSGDYTTVFFRQTIFVAVGVVIALVIALIPYRKYSLFFCSIALAITIPLLLMVLIEGSDALGARRWIDLGFTTLQPSEFAKIALILVMAHLVNRCRENGYSRTLIVLMIIACVVPVGLIVIEPDLGTTIIAVIGILAVLWFGGVPKRIIAVLVIGLVLFAALAIFGSGFRQSRFTAWLDPQSDPQGGGYQLLNSYYAFGGGGVFGVGLGLSRQKFNWLPQSENDFLFAIVGEELGLIGALVVMILFVCLVFLALKIARDAPDALGGMIAGAAGVIIGAQAFLNMLCVVGAVPITGKPLPFFSAGGSSISTTMILIGLIFSVSLQSTGVSVHEIRREQFSVVRGGRQQGLQAGGTGSVLSRLPSPAALVGALIPQKGTQSQQKRPDSRPSLERVPSSGRVRSAPQSKVVPISRGRAEKTVREARTQLRGGLPPSTVSPAKTLAFSRETKAVQDGRRKRPPQHTRVSQSQENAPISMASVRRNRVRISTGGSKSA